MTTWAKGRCIEKSELEKRSIEDEIMLSKIKVKRVYGGDIDDDKFVIEKWEARNEEGIECLYLVVKYTEDDKNTEEGEQK